MHDKCQIVEIENNKWLLLLNEDQNKKCFGYFCSKDEGEAYCKNYFGEIRKSIIDFEHPENRVVCSKIEHPPEKHRLWDFEDYKVMAWRNAGFRSRR